MLLLSHASGAMETGLTPEFEPVAELATGGTRAMRALRGELAHS